MILVSLLRYLRSVVLMITVLVRLASRWVISLTCVMIIRWVFYIQCHLVLQLISRSQMLKMDHFPFLIWMGIARLIKMRFGSITQVRGMKSSVPHVMIHMVYRRLVGMSLSAVSCG